jgi:hypothetical protein
MGNIVNSEVRRTTILFFYTPTILSRYETTISQDLFFSGTNAINFNWCQTGLLFISGTNARGIFNFNWCQTGLLFISGTNARGIFNCNWCQVGFFISGTNARGIFNFNWCQAGFFPFLVRMQGAFSTSTGVKQGSFLNFWYECKGHFQL